MRVVTLMCLALAGIVGVAGFGVTASARGTSAQPPAQAAPVPAQQQSNPPAQSATPAPAPAMAVSRGGSSAGLRAAERRRRSYASCNRESHNRSLRGGARRRFLIRCKLGYERRRPGQAPGQGAQPQTPPAQPVKPNPLQNPPATKAPSPQPQAQPSGKRP